MEAFYCRKQCGKYSFLPFFLPFSFLQAPSQAAPLLLLRRQTRLLFVIVGNAREESSRSGKPYCQDFKSLKKFFFN